ncbi:MAG: arginase family protein, partial [Gemmatimonadales bacterium]
MTQPNMPLNPPGSPLFRDHLEAKVASWIRPWDGAEVADVVLLGAPLSRTSISHSGASGTPQAMREMFAAVSTYNIDHDIDLASALTVRDAGDARVHVTDTARSRAGIRDAVSAVLARASG